MPDGQKLTGTLEWAEVNVNFLQAGPSHKWKCKNNCWPYCYARKNAIRFGQVDNIIECGEPKIVMPKSYPHEKRVMMPSSHDLFAEHLPQIKIILRELLTRDNFVLLVSKPRKDVIHPLLEWLPSLGELANVEFRFSITSATDEISLKYEPGASLPQERAECVRMVYDVGFPVSISMEPYLEAPGAMIQLLLSALNKERTDGKQPGMSIFKEWWFGAMNYGAPPELRHLYTKDYMAGCIRCFKDLGNCRFKDSFQRALGIDCHGVKR